METKKGEDVFHFSWNCRPDKTIKKCGRFAMESYFMSFTVLWVPRFIKQGIF
jgi:hypothetical protein